LTAVVAGVACTAAAGGAGSAAIAGWVLKTPRMELVNTMDRVRFMDAPV
jgi:hypothetical protein